MESTNEITLEYDVERIEKGLKIAYRVTNEAEESIFLATPLAAQNDSDVPDPERVYTYLDEQGHLHITKRFWEVPEDVDVYAPEVPRWTEVPAGCLFEETLTIATPVRLFQPYQEEVQRQTNTPAEVQGIVFSLGYMLAQHVEGLAGQTTTPDTGLLVDYATCAVGQGLLEGEMVRVYVFVETADEVIS